MEWNKKVKLIISDVDETIVDLYVKAEPEMIRELERILSEGIVLFLVSGQSVQNIQWRIVDHIKAELRRRIIIGHCSGAEVWGYDDNGHLRKTPFYSHYENALSEFQKQKWREIIQEMIKEFHLQVYPTMPVPVFKEVSDNDPLSIMMEDRGPQITFEVVNGYNLVSEQLKELEATVPIIHGYHDLRIPIWERTEKLFIENSLPITPRLAGVFAIDFAVKDVSKTTAVKYVIEQESILNALGMNKSDTNNPENMEVWGDKFSVTQGGTDRHICEALPKQVRSITFRPENPDELPEGYNIVIWDGKKHLHEGLLEYLKASNC